MQDQKQFEELFNRTRQASKMLVALSEEKINSFLYSLAEITLNNKNEILQANQIDLDSMKENDPKFDRLKLTDARIDSISVDIKNVASLPTPLKKILTEKTLPNGLTISKITVPLGVVGIIYEARPNVTFDVFTLCLKSGNACLLKGGSDAYNSNSAIVSLIKNSLQQNDFDHDIINLLPASHQAAHALLNASDYVDVVIPRGGQSLIDFVRKNAHIPIIETGAGIIHTFLDESADLNKAIKIINNAKTRRVSVCNALDCLIIHKKRLTDLPAIAAELQKSNVEIYADEDAFGALSNKYPRHLLHNASDEHFGTEFLDYKISIKTVAGLNEALQHIDKYSSKHSEAIISEDERNIEKFLNTVDAAAVYANTSTAFTDGAQFGLGAEIGISTQKLHARGPMALEELTSYKWIVRGSGQIRNP